MANWFLYRIEENTLETLFSEGYNSVIKMQSIAEEDLKDFRNINAVTRVQITMLRRFIQCLNCKQHPPVYPGAEGSGALFPRVLLGASGGPRSSSVTSTAPSTAVLHDLNTNPPEAQSHGSEFAHGAGPSTGRPNLESLQSSLSILHCKEISSLSLKMRRMCNLCKTLHAIHEAILFIATVYAGEI